jgi:hypothetical protein
VDDVTVLDGGGPAGVDLGPLLADVAEVGTDERLGDRTDRRFDPDEPAVEEDEHVDGADDVDREAVGHRGGG